MITLDQTLDMLGDGAVLSEPAILITFDDGYIDNYRLAFPILRRHAVQGVFFLATAFVGTRHLPWWDVIAYIVKHCQKRKICLEYPDARVFDLARDGVDACISRILSVYKQSSMEDHECFISALESACEYSRPFSDVERCFLNWDEARQMQQGGMEFGSHTHTHSILSKLPIERQREEVSVSRQILQQELGRDIETLAYPVGTSDAFSKQTIEILRLAGYRAAFSFYGGFNRPGSTQPFDISRCCVAGHSQPRFRLHTAAGISAGRVWF